MSALESSVTLEDVFVVVGAKRVPLAPELAGYLSLEIAEGAQQATGEVDPRSVYIGEEGSVALVVRPRREPRDSSAADAESSVRTILARLLEASGSQTPALAGVTRRRAGGGLAALVEELEAALIPVNRAAGRRALARLAREVKRVTLGVGRNASLAPGEPAREPVSRRGSSPSHSAVRDGGAPQRAPTQPQDEPQAAPRREPAQEVNAASPGAPHDASELPTVELRKDQLSGALAARSASPPRVEPTPAPRKPSEAGIDEVDSLLASFGVSGRGDQAARNELKALVGLEPTPPPPGSLGPYDDEPDARPPAPHASNDSDLDALLAISEPGPPVAARAAAPPYVAPPAHGGSNARGIASPPTAISPALANEPYGGARAPAMPATVASAVAPPASRPSGTSQGPTQGPSQTPPSQSDEGPRAHPTAPSARKLAEKYRTPTAPRTDRVLTMFLLVVLLAGGLAMWMLKPAFFTGHAPPRPPPPPVLSSAASAAAQAARCHASLVVSDAPPNAEILLRVGQAPVDVERMPIGARLEFVATAEGYAPKRAVIPGDATWDPGADGKPRYEVAVQLDRSRARPGAADVWPAGEPGSEVGGKGSPGTVHLVATPRGAEVWLLAGLGPGARIDQLKCGGDVDVLVAGPTTLRKRLHVAEGDFASKDGGPDREATVSAK